jgi:hypothetical protein
MLLVTDFVNLKIKLAQFFKYAHRNKMCIYMFIGVSTHTYINSYVCTVFLKKKVLSNCSLVASVTYHSPTGHCLS